MVGTSRFIVSKLCQLSNKSVGFYWNQKGYTQDQLILNVKIFFFGIITPLFQSERKRMKFFTRITDSYKKVVVTLGLMVTTNPLMAATSPATGVTETKTLVVQIISVLAIVGGCALGVKGIADIWKISDDIKRGQATVFAYAQPIAMLAVAGGIIYLSTKFGFNIGESGGAS